MKKTQTLKLILVALVFLTADLVATGYLVEMNQLEKSKLEILSEMNRELEEQTLFYNANALELTNLESSNNKLYSFIILLLPSLVLVILFAYFYLLMRWEKCIYYNSELETERNRLLGEMLLLTDGGRD